MNTLCLTLDHGTPMFNTDEVERFGVERIPDTGRVNGEIEIDVDWKGSAFPARAVATYDGSCPPEDVELDIHGHCVVVVVPTDAAAVTFLVPETAS